MTVAFIIFICISLLCTSFAVGFLVGMDSEMELYKDVFKHYKTSEQAYEQGIKIGFSRGWDMCADSCIERFCWNQKDWNKKHKEEIEREIKHIMIKAITEQPTE